MKPDLAELLSAVIAAYFIGLAVYIHEATYGSGGFLVTPSMVGECYAGGRMIPVQCEAVPDWYVFERPEAAAPVAAPRSREE